MSIPKIGLHPIQECNLTDDVMLWFNDEELMRYYTNTKQAITRESLLEHIRTGEKTGTSFTYGIFDLELDKIIGTIKLGPINKTHQISDLVVLIGDRQYHGRGLAIEAISLGNQLAFEEYKIRKLYGGMFASNIQSVKAYLRAGWIIEGVLCGHYFNNGKNEDRIEVGCFNPKYFTAEEIFNARRLTLEEYLKKYH